MGKALRVSALILLLTCSARADWMPNGSPVPPPSQPTSAVQEPMTDSEISTNKMPNDATEVWTKTALELLAVLPSLL